MDTTQLGLIIVALIVVLALVGWFVMQQRRTQALHQRFGPEYDRTVDATGGRRQAEADLEARTQRVEQLRLRPLAADERTRFTAGWQAVQARFVDQPAAATTEAAQLVAEVMQTRGYPVADFEQRAADISVDHPHVVEHYRAARAVTQRQTRGAANTEELRQAMVHYRALFADLLETTEPETTPNPTEPARLQQQEVGR